MTDIMLDLETMSTEPNAAVVAIGAVEFDTVARKIGRNFYTAVDLASSMALGGHVNAETVMWWMGQSEEARGALRSNPVQLPFALSRFTEWMAAVGAERVWGNGATFDNVILASAYRAAGHVRPWSYKGDRCFRTFCAQHPDVGRPPPFWPQHNALADARWQATYMLHMADGREVL